MCLQAYSLMLSMCYSVLAVCSSGCCEEGAFFTNRVLILTCACERVRKGELGGE
jgi:hypothetical protein